MILIILIVIYIIFNVGLTVSMTKGEKDYKTTFAIYLILNLILVIPTIIFNIGVLAHEKHLL